MHESDMKTPSIRVASPTNDRLFDASKTQPHLSEEEVKRLIAPNRTGEILLAAQQSAWGGKCGAAECRSHSSFLEPRFSGACYLDDQQEAQFGSLAVTTVRDSGP